MGRFVISGGKRLSGDVYIDGSKNAALPILFATILTSGVSVIENLPDISDVHTALDILRGFGARIWECDGKVCIDTTNLVYTEPSEELTSKIRASSYLLGACLGRFGKAKIQNFGGCNFDTRPIDMHLLAAASHGATVTSREISAGLLLGSDIHFDKISVGATVNAILMAVSAVGKSRIFCYAKEPHIISLVNFLISAGAKIKITSEYIEIVGAQLSGGRTKIIPDMIEAGTFLLLSLLCSSELRIHNPDADSLSYFLNVLRRSGVTFSEEENLIVPHGALEGYVEITTAPHPFFPTDLQPQTAPLLAAFSGGRINEGVWQGRFGYLKELRKFGVRYECSCASAEIYKSKIHSACAEAPDLRGGAALLMCALFSEGESIIENSEIIKRGYGDIVNKLSHIGADIIEIP